MRQVRLRPRRPEGSVQRAPRGEAVREVFLAFLRLGLISFGGPVAHLGHFRTAFVVQRRWLTDVAYADLVALCQFLPGPASSQVGMALGFSRAGIAGALAAWAGFTLPSALALAIFGLALLAFWRVPPWALVVLSALAGWGRAAAG